MSVPLYQLPEQQPSVWQPTSVEEAMHLKHQWGDNSVLISGGTWLRTRWENGLSSTPQHLISLGHIPALSGLTIDTLGHVHIGPACCLSDLMENELMRQRCGLLVQACSEIAAPSVRNLASIGGNVVTRTGDLIPVLLVMDAQVGWSDGQQERILPLKEWLESKHFTSYEVMTKIVVRASEEDRTEQTEAEQTDAEPQTNVEQTHAEQIDQDLEHSHEFYLKVGRRGGVYPIRCNGCRQFKDGCGWNHCRYRFECRRRKCYSSEVQRTRGRGHWQAFIQGGPANFAQGSV